jgi:hypothetical protein
MGTALAIALLSGRELEYTVTRFRTLPLEEHASRPVSKQRFPQILTYLNPVATLNYPQIEGVFNAGEYPALTQRKKAEA